MTQHETEIDRFRPSTVREVFGTLLGWAFLLTAFFACVLILFTHVAIVGLVILALALALLLVVWINNATTIYTVTDQRVIIRRGVFFRDVDEIELYRIKDLRADYSLINRIANIGTVALLSSDPTTANSWFYIEGIFDPVGRREALRNLVNDQRQGRQVREVDVARMI